MVSIAPRVLPSPESAQADSSVAVRSVTGPRTDWAKFCRAETYLFCLSARTPITSRAMRSVWSTCDQLVGELGGFVDVAFGQHREKGAAEQIGIVRIGL